MSLGLGYAPEIFYTTQQLIDALAPLRESGVPVTVHMRQEGAGVVEALEEMMTAARALRTPVHISHLKSIGKAYWGRDMPRMREILTRTREEGLDVSCDLYPYTAGSTQLIHVLPPESQDGGLAALTEDWELSRVARYKSQDMHDNRYFAHNSPTYGTPFRMLRAFGLSYRTAGENIAMGYAAPAAVVAGWMNSEGHRANILSSSYTKIGVGYVADGGYWTQWFVG